ncbi:DUF6301 family protein [Buchananella hordeovulneris]|uniref:DUF6301 family protein n=1 Tax=Buchananella hordeovulneris TaxID=52770 RepID=UPI0026DB986A|nr:DUF6301 family protein [Buchananella hordeovulneris]MDO5079895.1 DUF6301 family protein [Buchananella hordeovulneris]
MSDFRILGPDRCLELILAWAEADWPISWAQAFYIAELLGWRSATESPMRFHSELSKGEADCGFGELRGGVGDVDFPLSGRATNCNRIETERKIIALAAEVEALLTARYGAPQKSTTRRGVNSTKWQLDSGLSIDVFYGSNVIHVIIASPAQNRLLATAQAYLEEDGESEEL